MSRSHLNHRVRPAVAPEADRHPSARPDVPDIFSEAA
jgi:hypothetical protein